MEEQAVDQTLEVVLFGVGDLRTDDHEGLAKAMAQQNSTTTTTTTHNNKQGHTVTALCVLDAVSLTQIPGMVAHTADTVQLLVAALQDLAQDLQTNYRVPLTVVVPPVGVTLLDVLKQLVPGGSDSASSFDAVRVHVHDLGLVDNLLGYGPWAQLSTMEEYLGNQGYITVEPWTCPLRQVPWKQVSKLPDTFTDYRRQFLSTPAQSPVKVPTNKNNNNKDSSANVQKLSAKDLGCTLHGVVQVDALLKHVTHLLKLNPKRVAAEANTGLYMTHWGGLGPSTVGGRAALRIIEAYTGPDVQADDVAWTRHSLYPGRSARSNAKSLEHASMLWQLRGKGSAPSGDTQEWLAGEAMIRWAAAPLLFGTLSPRRVWEMAKNCQTAAPQFFFDPPLQTMVEGREWHRLLAARNIQTDPMYATKTGDNAATTPTSYRYWRYHGFLCRYAVTDMEKRVASSKESLSDGILLVHGFGASGAQWNKAMQALSTEGVFRQGLALDLLGFGHSEKPAVSYTAYLWDAIVCDFIKEEAMVKHGWESYVIGGNSIGGFTSMSAAASDSVPLPSDKDKEPLIVSSSGAPGSEKCKGLVLMNSAGPIQTASEIQAMLDKATNPLERASIAQITATGALPPCSPPARPVARTFGNGLLTYLRPNIQSICRNLYPTNPDAVDDELCQDILRDSLDCGAVNVMMSGAKLPVPRSSNEILQADFRLGLEESRPREAVFTGPVLVAQGILDPLNDANDRMKRFGALRAGITTSPINAGHCPHDELPVEVAKSIARWATSTATAAVRGQASSVMAK